MKNLFKSTTNTVTAISVVGTFILGIIVILFDINEKVDPMVIIGFWGMIIGHIVTKSTRKSSDNLIYKEMEMQEKRSKELPPEIEDIIRHN